MAVGSGVGEGEFTNRAQAVHAVTGRTLSNEASATVRIVPDADFDCTDVYGKVFDDANRNGSRTPTSTGSPACGCDRARSARGDGPYGRFHSPAPSRRTKRAAAISC
jgi:hypothetical protein